MTTTFKQRSLERLGYLLVEANHVIPIMEDGQVVDLRGPGFSWLNPLTQYALKPIYTGFRSLNFSISARTNDAVPITLELTISFTFNPCRAHATMAHPLAQAVAESDEVLTKIMRQTVGQCVRTVVGEQTAEAICSGCAWQQTESTLRSLLRTQIRPYGIRLAEADEAQADTNSNAAVTLVRIKTPPYLESAIELLRLRAMMAASFAMPPAQIEQWLLQMKLLEQLAAHGAPLHFWPSLPGQQPSALSMESMAQLQDTLTMTMNGQSSHSNGHSSVSTAGITPSVDWEILKRVPSSSPQRKAG